jgi:hypothetical protein
VHDEFDHRPFEEQLVRFAVSRQPSFDLLTSGRGADPEVAVPLGANRVAEPALDVVHRAPAVQVPRREAPDLVLAALVVPELDALAVVEGTNIPASAGNQRKPRPARSSSSITLGWRRPSRYAHGEIR